MDPAILLRRQHEDATTPIRARRLLVYVSAHDDESGLVVRQSLAAEGTLTSIQEEHDDFDFLRQKHATTWLTRDNPFLTPEQRDRLDERGLIPLNTLLQARDILASVLAQALPSTDQPTHEGKMWANDASWEAPANWAQTCVTHIEFLKDVPKGVSQRLRISVRAEHALVVGDLLLAEGKPLGVVGRLATEMPRAADIIVPRTVGARLGAQPGDTIELEISKAVTRGADVVQARATGLYSLITKQPLGNHEPGQHAHVNQIGWLLARGLDANVGELTSLKSDDLSNRATMRKLSEAGTLSPTAIPEPAAPESLLLLKSELMALGLNVTLEDTMRGVALTVSPSTTENILAWSSGQIRKPETINYRTLADEPGGLFCPHVFGSERFTRRRHFGHLELPCPVVSFLWRIGKPSALETILERPAKVLEQIVQYQAWIRKDSNDWVIEPATDTPGADWLTGADAIEALLKSVPADRLPAALQGTPELLVTRHVPILPPEFRPLVLLDSGNFATADVNDLYRRIINRANRLTKLKELKAPPVILQNEGRMLQQAYDALLANGQLLKKTAVLGESNRPLLDILELVVRGVLDAEKKRVDWSARARAVSSPALPDRHVMMPIAMFAKLALDPNRPVLLTNLEDRAGALVALLPRAHNDDVLALPGIAFRQIGLDRTAEPIAVVYRPLGVGACREADVLLEGDTAMRAPIPDTDGWIDATDKRTMIGQLVQAALTGTRVILRSARGVMLGGPGRIVFAEDADLPLAQRAVQEVAAQGAPQT